MNEIEYVVSQRPTVRHVRGGGRRTWCGVLVHRVVQEGTRASRLPLCASCRTFLTR